MKETRTRNRPFRVSLRARSTALWVARRSAVLARRLGLRLAACTAAAGAVGLAPLALGVPLPTVDADEPSTGGGRARVWTEPVGDTGVVGPLELSAEEGGDWGIGDPGAGAEMAMAIRIYAVGKW